MNRWVVIAASTLLVLVLIGGTYLFKGLETKRTEVVAPAAIEKATSTVEASASAEESQDDNGLPPASGDVVNEGEEVVE